MTRYFSAADDAAALAFARTDVAAPLIEELVEPTMRLGVLASLLEARSLPSYLSEVDAAVVPVDEAGAGTVRRLPESFLAALRAASDGQLEAVSARAQYYPEFAGVPEAEVTRFLIELRTLAGAGAVYAHTAEGAVAAAPKVGMPSGLRLLVNIGVGILVVFAVRVIIGLIGGNGVQIGSSLITAIFIGAVVGLATWFFSRRGQKSQAAAVLRNPGSFTFVIAPAPPLADNVAALRQLVGDSSEAPKITRYTRAVVAADPAGLTVSDKGEPFVTIPVADVVSVESRVASIKPAGTLIASNFPSVWVTVRRGGVEQVVAFTPIAGAYDKVSPQQADGIVAQVRARIGIAG